MVYQPSYFGSSKNNTFREGGLENKTTWKNKLLKILHPTFSEMDSSD